MDRVVAHRCYPHKHYKWTHAVFFWILTAALNNAWVIWCSVHSSKETFDEFITNFIGELRKEGGKTMRHELVSCSPESGKCSRCQENDKLSSTTLRCTGCRQWLHESCYQSMRRHKVKTKRVNTKEESIKKKKDKKEEKEKLKKERVERKNKRKREN